MKRFSTIVLASLLAVPVLGVPAAAGSDTVATTTLGELIRADLYNGAPALIGATATQSFHGTPADGQLLGAPIT